MHRDCPGVAGGDSGRKGGYSFQPVRYRRGHWSGKVGDSGPRLRQRTQHADFEAGDWVCCEVRGGQDYAQSGNQRFQCVTPDIAARNLLIFTLSQ